MDGQFTLKPAVLVTASAESSSTSFSKSELPSDEKVNEATSDVSLEKSRYEASFADNETLH